MLNVALARQRRKEMGLSLAELGGLVGVDASTLYRWESGEFEPRSIDKLRDWARVLSVPVADLLDEPDNSVLAEALNSIDPGAAS